MILNPAIGQRVRLHYAKAKRPMAPHHGKLGTIVVRSQAKPRNHLVKLDTGEKVIVPCGNLMKVGD